MIINSNWVSKKSYKRIICPAIQLGRAGVCGRFIIYIEYSYDRCLSMRGSWHGHGQISEQLTDERLIPSEGYTYQDLVKLQEIWQRWHLNHMKAGTPKQENFVKNWKSSNASPFDYKEVCKALEDVGLLVDNGYKYGSKWLKEEVPDDVLRYLFSVPAISGDDWLKIMPVDVNEDEFLNIIS